MGFAFEGCMMKAQSGSSVEDTDEKYAHLWFASLCKFHVLPDNESQQWNFVEKHVLAFLRHKLAKKTPTWKRLKIVHGLIWYRNHVRRSRTPRLEHHRACSRTRCEAGWNASAFCVRVFDYVWQCKGCAR